MREDVLDRFDDLLIAHGFEQKNRAVLARFLFERAIPIAADDNSGGGSRTDHHQLEAVEMPQPHVRDEHVRRRRRREQALAFFERGRAGRVVPLGKQCFAQKADHIRLVVYDQNPKGHGEL